jgi:UPF0271 protein
MPTVDINCDMGEGMDNDAAIMPFISSVNIACGYHAGDEKTMWDTIALAIKHRVKIGAHVSFHDKENFGRSEMQLDGDDVYDLVTQQLIIMNEIADSFKLCLHHVKPHGALYNMSARNEELANAIARAVKDFDQTLVLFGLSGSCSISEAKEVGLATASEVFADRAYQDDGRLVPRSKAGAMIENETMAVAQVIQMIKEGKVTTGSGKLIDVVADTVCIHGDGPHAVKLAKSINAQLKQNKIDIKAL